MEREEISKDNPKEDIVRLHAERQALKIEFIGILKQQGTERRQGEIRQRVREIDQRIRQLEEEIRRGA